VSVTVGYVHGNEVSHSFAESYLNMILQDKDNDGPLSRGGWVRVRCGTDGLPAARNETVLQFLATESDWLFVGALCFAQREMAGDGSSGYRCTATPTIYDWAHGVDMKGKHRQGFVARTEYDVNALNKCGATGSAAILIHRSVFEAVREQFGPVWYNRAPEGEPDARGVVVMLGEDMSFCMRAGSLGIPVHVHTGVRTTHHKAVWLAETDYIDQWTLGQVRAAQAAAHTQPVADATSA
jgi:hypothetical protein